MQPAIRGIVLAGLTAACSFPASSRVADVSETGADAVVGTSGMVSSAHPIATDAGVGVLEAGGNAFDAAVAIAATLGVVEPMMSGMGGYGTILVYSVRENRVRFLNSSSRIPRAVDSDAFRPPTPGYRENRRGAKAVSTPGNVHAWEALWKAYGATPWERLFEDAIAVAETGYVVGPIQALFIQGAFEEFPEHSRRFYGRNGAPLQAHDRLVQRDLAAALRLVARSGASAFYSGSIAATIDSTMRAAGGFLSLDDLRADSATWWDPISIDYRGVRVYSASPPANTFDALARLGIMERFDAAAMGHNSVAWLHTFAEATKLGFWLRLRHAGDPDVAPPPVSHILSSHFLDSLAALIDSARARPFVAPSTSAGSMHTTHFVVADQWGNVVSATQTIGNVFGSRIMPPGTGIWLNNSLAYSTFEPRGNPMDAFAGRYKLSGDVPVIAFRDGRPWLAVGTPGGHSIGQTVPQMIMNLVDFGMSAREALTAPRISFAEPDVLLVEEAIGPQVRAALAERGHTIRTTQGIGNAHALVIRYDQTGVPRRFEGAADPRGEGKAAAPSASRRSP